MDSKRKFEEQNEEQKSDRIASIDNGKYSYNEEIREILRTAEENAKDPQPIMPSGLPFGWSRLDNIPKQGVKESDGKLSYELDFEFIKEVAIRMEANKGKYPPYNWMKPMDVEKLTEALKRHAFEVFTGNYKDGEDPFGHITALACNSMMIWRQLKNKENDTD